jgi:UDP-GlcNAc3NAcA epimerase
MTRHTVVTIVGARPQFVKASTVSRSIERDGRLDERLVHTGQHHDHELSEAFFLELEIPPPAYHLGVHGGTHGHMTGRMLEAIEDVLLAERPEIVVVYGDTNSTLAGALAAAKLHIPVAHVEAGLRSFNREMPEEVNRVVTDHISNLLFCPTTTAVGNLEREGINHGVHLVGDVMYDAALRARDRARDSSEILEKLGLQEGFYAVATVHRAENTDEACRLAELIRYLREEARECPIVFPMHPRTALSIERWRLGIDGLLVCPPVSYLDMARLLGGAVRVYTDSGGMQKEAYFHRVPCVTLREETEWTETVEAGWNRLWRHPDAGARREIHEYGEGRAADAIVEALCGYLRGRGECP